ncbi:aldolase [Vibrio sp. JC009]|uniref:3-oxo-tetronate 4-phosphate decarboxylase n=1 Tax=Vibrio sp. JC009 TaxID=2912314 RepID=UPI0023AF5C5F|nr:aldolase [Vibrio sp. JC009]WED24025.1 aldolase [Vibrio sp. JC009]
MSDRVLRQKMVSLARSLFERGYATGGAGNLSLKLPSGNILATPTGSSMGRLDVDTLSVVDIEGNHLSGDKPSKEVTFHLELYRNNSSCNAVVHLHSTYLTALSCLKGIDPDNVIKPFTPYYVMRVGKMPLIPYFNPGDPQIAVELAKRATDYRAFLLANHGPVVTGASLEDAMDNIEELEETAKLSLMLKEQEIQYLSDKNVNELSRRLK